jgi:hypothetical protein
VEQTLKAGVFLLCFQQCTVLLEFLHFSSVLVSSLSHTPPMQENDALETIKDWL